MSGKMLTEMSHTSGVRAWFQSLAAMARKEFIIISRYPIEFVASFGSIFLVIAIMTLAGWMFAPQGFTPGRANSTISNLIIYGFVIYIYFNNTLWNIGYNIRREQKQGTLEQLYLSPASKIASLISRVILTLLWTGTLLFISTWLMSALIGQVAFFNPGRALLIFVFTLTAIFGLGFAFSALTLRLRETTQTLVTFFDFFFIVMCAPFYPFAVLPDWAQAVSRLIPLSYKVEAFRATLTDYPNGFPELAPINVELAIIISFGILMPVLGIWLYRRAEENARMQGSLAEY